MRTKKVKNLQQNDFLDLEGDEYADPNHNNPQLEFQWAIVGNIERETPDCIRVDFNFTSVGFPPNHEVSVGEQSDIEQGG